MRWSWRGSRPGSARSVVVVASDDVRMAQLAETLAFFAPEIEQLEFPAWDCLPYDRVSPNAEIVSRRIDTLSRLAAGRRRAARASC